LIATVSTCFSRATSESVLVRYDYTLERPVPLSDAHVAAIEAFEGRPLRQSV
jgi:hypothetical protein